MNEQTERYVPKICHNCKQEIFGANPLFPVDNDIACETENAYLCRSCADGFIKDFISITCSKCNQEYSLPRIMLDSPNKITCGKCREGELK